MATDTATMLENPEYQETIRKLMQAPPAVRAVANFSSADEVFMKQQMEKDLELRKLGTAKKATFGKLGLEREKLNIDKTLGLGTSQAYYNLRTNAARDALDTAKLESNLSTLVGAANVGAGIYGMNQQNKMTEKLLPLMVRRGV